MLGLQRKGGFGVKPADFGLALIGGANRRHFRHAPGMDHAHAVFFLIGLRDGGRAGGTANHHALQRINARPRGFHMLQQHHPNRGHGGRKIHARLGDDFMHRSAIQLGARQNQRGAGHGGRDWQGPAIGVEHRHHRHDAISNTQPQTIHLIAGQRMQNI